MEKINKILGMQLTVQVEGMEHYTFRNRKVNLTWDLTDLVENLGMDSDRVKKLLEKQDSWDDHVRLVDMAKTYVLYGGYGVEDGYFSMYVSDEGYDILFDRTFEGLDEETGIESITLKVFGVEVR